MLLHYNYHLRSACASSSLVDVVKSFCFCVICLYSILSQILVVGWHGSYSIRKIYREGRNKFHRGAVDSTTLLLFFLNKSIPTFGLRSWWGNYPPSIEGNIIYCMQGSHIYRWVS